MHNKPRIFVADDHAIVRKGLVDILEAQGYQVVGQTDNIPETLSFCHDEHPDCIILDLNMGDDSGVPVIGKILDIYSEANILVFSMRESVQTIRSAYQMGAKGYVTKTAGPELLIEAVKLVITGNNYYMPGVPEMIVDYDVKQDKEKDPRDVLTEKELLIFRRYADGVSYYDIANELNVSSRHISNKVIDIRNKLGISITSFEWIARKYNLLKLDL